MEEGATSGLMPVRKSIEESSFDVLFNYSSLRLMHVPVDLFGVPFRFPVDVKVPSPDFSVV